MPTKTKSTTSAPSEDAVRQRAYLMWEADGRPDGLADHYWLKASEVVAGGQQAEAEGQERGVQDARRSSSKDQGEQARQGREGVEELAAVSRARRWRSSRRLQVGIGKPGLDSGAGWRVRPCRPRRRTRRSCTEIRDVARDRR